MQELEKILEEIGELRGQAGSECTSEDHYIKKAWEHCLDRVVGIIRKHMNDGWIPVEEALPEDDSGKRYIITDKSGNVYAGLLYGYADDDDDKPCFHNWDDECWRCFKPDVAAWAEYPDPYRPERSAG